MYGELISDEQGGREYEQYYEENMAKARKEWMEETNGDISFDSWLDMDEDPEEEE